MSCTRGDNRKFQKIGESDDKDRISKLPDGVISKILSCLPTKTAIRTSVLSRAWEYKWTSAYRVRIDYRTRDEQEIEKRRLIKGVHRILLRSPNIRSFEFISVNVFNASHLETWTYGVLTRRNIEKFIMCAVVNSDAPDDEIILYHRSLLKHCTSLRELGIGFSCTYEVPHKISFTNLTKFSFENVKIVNTNSSINTLVFSLPMLKELFLGVCRWLGVKFVEMHAPLLTDFTYVRYEDEVDDCAIKILGARLTDFRNYGPLPETLLLTGSTVQCAFVNLIESTANAGFRARRLLNEFSNLSELKLSCTTGQALAITQSGLPIPKYDKLKKLRLTGNVETGYEYSTNVETMFLLFHAAPFLEYLIVDIEIPGTDSTDEKTYEQVEDGYDYEEVESISVPSCLSQIKKVKFKRLGNTRHHFNLVRFLLKNCPRLKEFRVNCDRSEMDTNELRRKLSSFPHAAKRVGYIISWKG